MNPRRQFLKTGAALALWSLNLERVAHGKENSPQWALVIDLDRCMGCETCAVACKVARNLPAGRWDTRVRSSETGIYPLARQKFLPVQCNHCHNAPCTSACPKEAIRRLPSGIVIIDRARCRGKGACVRACPFGAITLVEENGDSKAGKCDFCVERLEDGDKGPACVASCPTGARMFGDLKHPTGEFAQYIRSRRLYARSPAHSGGVGVLYAAKGGLSP